MNYKGHLTHHNGIPLAQMGREELIEALQQYSVLYTEMRDAFYRDKQNRGLVEKFNS
jgi:hypothetical protein